MPLELNSIGGLEPGETAPAQDMAGAGPAEESVHAAPETAEDAEPPDGDADDSDAASLLAEISVAVREVADLSRRYHARAEQREGVIDFLRSELDTLRRGERRGLLRPVLADLCRLREDLLSQAAALPADFDAPRAAELLRSYAETIELTLESNGVVTYAPAGGDRFDPRLHRRVGGEPTADPALPGHIGAVRRDGYLDIEANSAIAPADVTVFTAAPPEAAVTETEAATEATATEGQQ